MDKPKKPARLRYLPWIIGALGIGGLWLLISICTKYCHFSDPYIYTGEEARAKINQNVLVLPASATNLYFYCEGWSDHRVLIAFSAPRKDLDRIVEQLTEKKIANLPVWKGQVSRNEELYGPSEVDLKYKTELYDLDKVKNVLYYQSHEGGLDALIYDRNFCRVYYVFVT